MKKVVFSVTYTDECGRKHLATCDKKWQLKALKERYDYIEITPHIVCLENNLRK